MSNITDTDVIYIILSVCFILYCSFLLYKAYYFRSKLFYQIKDSVESYINDCNTLNQYITNLCNELPELSEQQVGTGILSDKSQYNYKRKHLSDFKYNQNIVNCSNTVLRNARNSPLKYLCKYFNIAINNSTLEQINKSIELISIIESGKESLTVNRNNIIYSISNTIPAIIKLLAKTELISKLGFDEISINETIISTYQFKYISTGGKSSSVLDISLDLDNLEKLNIYISDLVEKQSTIKYQRQLMTRTIRETIKNRDNHTCQICDNSIHKEPNLLLEIDHIIPVSKGGMTIEENLQTLCWRCNRTKGNKI